MSSIDMLTHGFAIALAPTNILAAIVGVVLGTLAGMLPGLGITGTIALLIPVSFGLDPLTALVIFAGIYYGAMYGGSTTSILVNVPGEGASVITCIEGYAMAKKGRAGAALSVAAFGSFVAGTVGLAGLVFFAPLVSRAALAFGPPEHFCIAALALVVLSGIGSTSMLRSTLMVAIGLMLGTVGIDPTTGVQRFAFGSTDLMNGIPFIVVVMGAYGLGEVLESAGQYGGPANPPKIALRDLYPTREEARRSVPAICRGSLVGFIIGLIPGPSGSISSFLSYAVEKSVSRGKKEFGSGAIEGVAGPESANNGAESAALIPLLSLGLPFNAASAALLTGFLIHGITPGPLLISQKPDLFWGLIASMFVGNVFLLIINMPLVGIFASLLRIPMRVLMPMVAVLVMIGAYVLNNNLFDVWLAVIFGILGFFLRRTGYSIVPLVIGLFLSPLIENGLTQSLMLLDGDPLALFNRPLSGAMLWAAILFLVARMARAAYVWRKGKRPPQVA